MHRRSSSRLLAATSAVAAWVVIGAVTAVLATATAAQAQPAAGSGDRGDRAARAGSPATAPVASTTDATDLTDTAATLSGAVASSDATAITWFDWGTTADYGRTTPEVHLTGAAEQPVTASLTGLLPSTTYHYRLVAANGTGTTRTTDATFTTAAAPAPSGGSGTAGAVSGAPVTDPTTGSPSLPSTSTSTSTSSTTTTSNPLRLATLTIGNGGAAGTPTVSTTRVSKPSIRLPVTCASGPTCVGALTVFAPRRPTLRDAQTSAPVASASFAIPSGTRVTLKMGITPASRSLIAAAKRASQRVTVAIVLSGQPSTQTRIALATQPR